MLLRARVSPVRVLASKPRLKGDEHEKALAVIDDNQFFFCFVFRTYGRKETRDNNRGNETMPNQELFKGLPWCRRKYWKNRTSSIIFMTHPHLFLWLLASNSPLLCLRAVHKGVYLWLCPFKRSSLLWPNTCLLTTPEPLLTPEGVCPCGASLKNDHGLYPPHFLLIGAVQVGTCKIMSRELNCLWFYLKNGVRGADSKQKYQRRFRRKLIGIARKLENQVLGVGRCPVL